MLVAHAFQDKILKPGGFVSTGSRWDADLQRFRENARTGILARIESGKSSHQKEAPKKIQGGC